MEQCISCWPFTNKKLKGSNHQDFVFIRPPGAFELWLDNLWFCKVLLLFQMKSKTDMGGWKSLSCAFVSVMEEYTGPQQPGIRLSLFIKPTFLIVLIVLSSLTLYLILLCSLVGQMLLNYYLWTQHAVPSNVCHPNYCRLALVPIGETGAIPFSMSKESINLLSSLE